eukprot:6183438-Pleurochrysis_carterae.AAC.1
MGRGGRAGPLLGEASLLFTKIETKTLFRKGNNFLFQCSFGRARVPLVRAVVQGELRAALPRADGVPRRLFALCGHHDGARGVHRHDLPLRLQGHGGEQKRAHLHVQRLAQGVRARRRQGGGGEEG